MITIKTMQRFERYMRTKNIISMARSKPWALLQKDKQAFGHITKKGIDVARLPEEEYQKLLIDTPQMAFNI